MQNLLFLTLFLVFTFFLSCQQGVSEGDTLLVTKFSKTSLREESNEKSREITVLPQNTRLKDLQKVSKNATQIELEGADYEEPWIKVAVPKGDSGWVFAASVQLLNGDSLAQQNWLYHLRLQRLIGKSLAQKMTDWRNSKFNENSASVLPYYEEIKFYQDTLNSLLQKKVSSNSLGVLPNLFWMSDLSKDWLIQTINEEKYYRIFLNYRELGEKARLTKDPKDDAFFAIYQRIFPVDSIESYLPCWKIQTDEQTFYSLLGAGKHRELLQMLATELSVKSNENSFFDTQLESTKEDLLSDILNKKTAYWNAQENIKSELVKILAIKPTSFFSKSELIALETRLKMFDDAIGNGVLVNVRSGEIVHRLD
jgi:hypothetical protein